VRSQLAPPPATPIEAYLRRSDWRLAVLVVTLVAVPGALDLFQQVPAGHVRPDGGARHAPASRRARTVAGRHVRPPRSC
jgi:hypothetical protein